MNSDQPIAPMKPSEKASNNTSFFAASAIMIAFAMMAYGAVLLLFQIYFWLKQGTWHEIPLLACLGISNGQYPQPLSRWLPASPLELAFVSWVIQPTSWLGFHKVVIFIHVTIGLPYILLFGPLFIFTGYCVWDDENTINRRSRRMSKNLP